MGKVLLLQAIEAETDPRSGIRLSGAGNVL